jgi:ABC-type metal ion transport system substrate-binding protein
VESHQIDVELFGQHLKYFNESTQKGSHQVVAAAGTILNKITREEIFCFNRKSGLF